MITVDLLYSWARVMPIGQHGLTLVERQTFETSITIIMIIIMGA